MIEVIYPNKVSAEIVPRQGDLLTLLQNLVGGYIELVQTPHTHLDVIVNEEGRFMRLGPNEPAKLRLGQPLVGPVVILSGEDRLK